MNSPQILHFGSRLASDGKKNLASFWRVRIVTTLHHAIFFFSPEHHATWLPTDNRALISNKLKLRPRYSDNEVWLFFFPLPPPRRLQSPVTRAQCDSFSASQLRSSSLLILDSSGVFEGLPQFLLTETQLRGSTCSQRVQLPICLGLATTGIVGRCSTEEPGLNAHTRASKRSHLLTDSTWPNFGQVAKITLTQTLDLTFNEKWPKTVLFHT